MKIKILNVWLVCTLLLVTLLNAQAISRVDKRVESPTKASAGKTKEPAPQKKDKSAKGIVGEAVLDEKPEKIYPVNGFSISYGKEHPDLPTIEQLKAIEVYLNLKDGIYTQGSEGDLSVSGQPASTRISICRSSCTPKRGTSPTSTRATTRRPRTRGRSAS